MTEDMVTTFRVHRWEMDSVQYVLDALARDQATLEIQLRYVIEQRRRKQAELAALVRRLYGISEPFRYDAASGTLHVPHAKRPSDEQ